MENSNRERKDMDYDKRLIYGLKRCVSSVSINECVYENHLGMPRTNSVRASLCFGVRAMALIQKR